MLLSGRGPGFLLARSWYRRLWSMAREIAGNEVNTYAIIDILQGRSLTVVYCAPGIHREKPNWICEMKYPRASCRSGGSQLENWWDTVAFNCPLSCFYCTINCTLQFFLYARFWFWYTRFGKWDTLFPGMYTWFQVTRSFVILFAPLRATKEYAGEWVATRRKRSWCRSLKEI